MLIQLDLKYNNENVWSFNIPEKMALLIPLTFQLACWRFLLLYETYSVFVTL